MRNRSTILNKSIERSLRATAAVVTPNRYDAIRNEFDSVATDEEVVFVDEESNIEESNATNSVVTDKEAGTDGEWTDPNSNKSNKLYESNKSDKSNKSYESNKSNELNKSTVLDVSDQRSLQFSWGIVYLELS